MSTSGTPLGPKDKAELANQLATLGYKAAAGAGALITFWYLFSIEFFPSGLTPGEALFFIFAAFVFGSLYVIFVVYSAFAALWLARLVNAFCRWAFPGTHSLVPTALQDMASLMTSILVSLVLAVSALAVNKPKMYSVVCVAILIGFFVLMLASTADVDTSVGPPAPPQPGAFWKRWAAIAVLPMVFICMFIGPKFLTDLAFRSMGIRAENVAIELPVSEAGALAKVAEALGRQLVDCKKAGTDKLLVHGTTVLWSKIGEQALVEFSNPSKDEPKWFAPTPPPARSVTLHFDAKSMRVVKSRPLLDPCFELPTDLLFETGRHEITASALPSLRTIVSSVGKGETIFKVHVQGHSDARPLRAKTKDGKVLDNQGLSELRAAAVAEQLRKLIVQNVPATITSDGAGSRELKVRCEERKDVTKYEQEQCNRPNRRVEVRVTLGKPAAELP